MGNTKQVIMEGKMREKARCPCLGRVLQKGKMRLDPRTSGSVSRHSDHFTITSVDIFATFQLISVFLPDGVDKMFLQPNAAARIQTHVSTVAPILALWKDALPSEQIWWANLRFN